MEVFPLPSLYTPTHRYNRDIRWLHFTPFLYRVRNTLISSVKGRKNVLLFYHSVTLTSVYYYKLVNLRWSTRSSWYFSLEFQNWHFFFVFFPSHASDPCRGIIGGRDYIMDCKCIQNYQIIIVFCANGGGGTKQNPSVFSAYISKENIYQTKALAYLRKAVIFDQKFRGTYTEVSPNSQVLSYMPWLF